MSVEAGNVRRLQHVVPPRPIRSDVDHAIQLLQFFRRHGRGRHADANHPIAHAPDTNMRLVLRTVTQRKAPHSSRGVVVVKAAEQLLPVFPPQRMREGSVVVDRSPMLLVVSRALYERPRNAGRRLRRAAAHAQYGYTAAAFGRGPRVLG